MKSESEKKSVVKSIKLSPSQLQQIEEKANEKNMTFSSYMVDCALELVFIAKKWYNRRYEKRISSNKLRK